MAKELESVIVVSQVKKLVKDGEMRSGDEFITALNEQVHMIIKHASNRAKANGRQTLKGEDI
jgi:histone H3/H4